MQFSFKKMHYNLPSAPCRPFCLGINVLTPLTHCRLVTHICINKLSQHWLLLSSAKCPSFCPVKSGGSGCWLIIITVTSQWARWHLRSPASRLFTQPFIQAQIKENIKAPRHWPLCGEFTGERWIPRTKGSNAENVSIWWRHHVNKNARIICVATCSIFDELVIQSNYLELVFQSVFIYQTLVKSLVSCEERSLSFIPACFDKALWIAKRAIYKTAYLVKVRAANRNSVV